MRLSKDYTKSIKEQGKEYDSISHELLIKGGYVDQVASGIFTWLTPGLQVINKINAIVRKELDEIGSLEVLMPNLHPRILWTDTKRWDSVDVLFKLKSSFGSKEYALGCSHEEVVTPLAKKYIQSYKDLPLSIFQINSKFRDEPRAKSGVLRGREFLMKDMYSFHASQEDLKAYYEKVSDTYMKIFKQLGFDNVRITQASGGDFTDKISHEFNIITPAGEVDLIYCNECDFTQNTEIAKAGMKVCPKCDGKLETAKAIEIGNIFDLGTKFSKDCGLSYADEKGKLQYPYMGCYGIGITRLIGALVESHHDEKGIVWPEAVTPFHAHLINIKKEDTAFADLIYRSLKSEGLDILFDDREDIRAGEKFAVADTIGVPIRLLVSDRNEDQIELKLRTEEKTRLYSAPELIQRLKEYYLA
ncbi:MAG: proline--tRNA ligase [Candidatus Roizmanbacteria bacterium]